MSWRKRTNIGSSRTRSSKQDWMELPSATFGIKRIKLSQCYVVLPGLTDSWGLLGKRLLSINVKPSSPPSSCPQPNPIGRRKKKVKVTWAVTKVGSKKMLSKARPNLPLNRPCNHDIWCPAVNLSLKLSGKLIWSGNLGTKCQAWKHLHSITDEQVAFATPSVFFFSGESHKSVLKDEVNGRLRLEGGAWLGGGIQRRCVYEVYYKASNK